MTNTEILQSILQLVFDIRERVAGEIQAAPRVAILRSLSLDATPAQVAPDKCLLVGWYLSNSRTSPVYIKFYDAVNAPNVATSKPDMTIMLPALCAANISFPRAIPFKLGLFVIATTLPGDTDTTSPNANEVMVNLFFE